MTKEVLQKDLVDCFKRRGMLYTRLRTPGNRCRGVRYPADFVLWGEYATWLIECKQRKDLPLEPSDIRQMPFMKEWVECAYIPTAKYCILVYSPEGYSLFTYRQAVSAHRAHKGLTKSMAVYTTQTLNELLDKMEEIR